MNKYSDNKALKTWIHCLKEILTQFYCNLWFSIFIKIYALVFIIKLNHSEWILIIGYLSNLLLFYYSRTQTTTSIFDS